MAKELSIGPVALSRRSFVKSALLVAGASAGDRSLLFGEEAGPVCFWHSDGTLPGDLAMLVGGGFENSSLRGWRVADAAPGEPVIQGESPPAVSALKVLDRSNDVLKYQIPSAWRPGVFAVHADGAAVRYLNRPLVWFVQPVELRPGLRENEVPPGATAQIIGKDFLLADESGDASVAMRPANGAWRRLPAVKQVERYSLLVEIPSDLAAGAYELSVHNGFGGPEGWSVPLHVQVKQPNAWPATIYDVRKLGALGDDVHDDTEAVRKALRMAEDAGGGVVYFPFGTYRLSGPIAIPARTLLRGEMRDISILKWPEDEPMTLADMTPAAIYTGSEFGIEDLTLIARKVERTLLDLSYEHTHRGTVPKEFLRLMRPWSRYRDIFLRRVQFQHWFSASHPDRNPDPKMVKKFFSGDGPFNLLTGNCVNFEVSDCIFQGGNNAINGPQNGRVTGNSFSNEMNYCWTVLGGGAAHLVVQHNEIRASSSFGFGSLSLQYIYSAHNTSYNFVRGEREAMTLDVSSMPTQRARAEYWGTPTEVNNQPGAVTLRFPAATAAANLDGFRTGFLPGQFRGGQAIVHACNGGAGGGQTRLILDNTADTVTLEKPWSTLPETTPRQMYMELSPRKSEYSGVTNAWAGTIEGVTARSLRGSGAHWVPGELIDQCVMILDGTGAGQYRVVRSNTEQEVFFDQPWDAMPVHGAAVAVWAIVRHITVYKSTAFDTSAFAQLYGSGYDYTVDGCHVERTQGIWGQMGWFVQLCRNEVSVGYSYHRGIGPPGPTPEHNTPYGINGLTGSQLRLTKFAQVQYPEIPAGTAIFVDKLVGKAVPVGFVTTLRRNRLRWNQRLVLGMSGNTKAPRRFHHALVDGNTVEHSAVGVQIGADADGVLAGNNRFLDVAEPFVTIDAGSLKQL